MSEEEPYYKIECPICGEEVITKEDTLDGFKEHCVYTHRMIDVIRALVNETDLYGNREKYTGLP